MNKQEAIDDIFLAMDYIKQEKLDEAKSIASRICNHYPNLHQPVCLLAHIALKQVDFELAAALYDQVLTMDLMGLNVSDLLTDWGIAFAGQQQHAQASKYFNRALLNTTDNDKRKQLEHFLFLCNPKDRFNINAQDYDIGYMKNEVMPTDLIFIRLMRLEQTISFERVLDLGCGTGQSGQLLRKVSRHLTGVDISPKMLEKAFTKGIYDKLVESDVLGFLETEPPVCYSLIFSSMVFPYFDHLDNLFKLLARALHTDGIVAFDLTNTSDFINFVGKKGQSLQFAHNPAYVIDTALKQGLILIETTQHIFHLSSEDEPSTIYLFRRA